MGIKNLKILGAAVGLSFVLMSGAPASYGSMSEVQTQVVDDVDDKSNDDKILVELVTKNDNIETNLGILNHNLKNGSLRFDDINVRSGGFFELDGNLNGRFNVFLGENIDIDGINLIAKNDKVFIPKDEMLYFGSKEYFVGDGYLFSMLPSLDEINEKEWPISIWTPDKDVDSLFFISGDGLGMNTLWTPTYDSPLSMNVKMEYMR